MFDEALINSPWEDEPNEHELARLIREVKEYCIASCLLETESADSLALKKPDWEKPWSQLTTLEIASDIMYAATYQHVCSIFKQPEILALPWSHKLRAALIDQWLTPPLSRPQ